MYKNRLKNMIVSSFFLLGGCASNAPTYPHFINPSTKEVLNQNTGYLVIAVHGELDRASLLACRGGIYLHNNDFQTTKLSGFMASKYRKFVLPINFDEYKIDLKFTCGDLRQTRISENKKNISFIGKKGRINLISINLDYNKYNISTESIDEPELAEQLFFNKGY